MRNCAGLYRFVDWLLRWTDTVQSILLKMNNTVKIRYQLYTFQFVCYSERNEQKRTLNMSAFAGYPQLVSAFLLHNYRWPVIYVLGAKSQSQPAQHAFPCGLGTKNEEQESKTSRKMAQVKERAGGGEERKFPFFPSPSPLFHFLAFVSFLARPKPRIPFLDLGLFFLPNQTETLATQAIIERETEEELRGRPPRSLFFPLTSL